LSNLNLIPNFKNHQILLFVVEFHEDLARFSSGKYYNEAEPDMAPSQWKKEFWSDSAYEKLVDIKKAWDPQNIFTCNLIG